MVLCLATWRSACGSGPCGPLLVEVELEVCVQLVYCCQMVEGGSLLRKGSIILVVGGSS